MSWNDEVERDRRGRLVACAFSTDNFSTIDFRAADVAANVSGNWYDARIVSISRITRAFGQDRISAGARFDITLDNSDGFFDTWFNKALANTTWKLRCRLSIYLYDVTAPVVSVGKQLGEFAVRRFLRRNSHVVVTFEDDMLARFTEGLQPPTIRDWAATDDEDTNPIFNDPSGPSTGGNISLPPNVSMDTPIPLVFGSDWVETFGPMAAIAQSATYEKKSALLICCSADTPSTPTQLRMLLSRKDGMVFEDIPSTFVDPRDPHGSFPIWTYEVSSSIVMTSGSFIVGYIVIDNEALCNFLVLMRRTHLPPLLDDGAGGYMNGDGRDLWPFKPDDGQAVDYSAVSANGRWFVKGSSLSGTQSAAKNFHPAYVLKDLAESYSQHAIAVSSTGLSNAYAAATDAAVVGKVSDGNARTAVSAICRSSDMDVFINYSGQLDFCMASWTEALAAEMLSATPGFMEIFEHQVSGVEEWLPEPGERGAFFNKYFSTGLRDYDAELKVAPTKGPFIYTSQYAGTYAVDPDTRLLEGEIDWTWAPYDKTTDHPFATRALQLEVVPRIRFKGGLHLLRLDLGEFFYFTWSRGVSPAVYDQDLFQVESISWDHATDEVEFEAIFRRDNDRPGYILDDESKRLITSSATFAGDPTVTDSSTTVNFSAGDLTAAGVLANDILVLLDATLATGVYTRFRALRIASINTATQVTIASSDLDFDAPSGSAVVTWKILRGAITDMTGADYSTGDYYGKASTNANQDSGGSQASVLTGG